MKLVLFIVFGLGIAYAMAQETIAPNDIKFLKKKEDSLKLLSRKIVSSATFDERWKSDSTFTKVFIRALKTKNSYLYPFDSVNISKLSSPDDKFKIFTWQINIDGDKVRQHGAIQMKTDDGSLKLFPLIDKSDNIEDVSNFVGDNLNWVGALYYKIVKTSFSGKEYYSLLGFDDYSIKSSKKYIDILRFENGKPIFGENIFVTPANAANARYTIEYKRDANTKLVYDDESKMIVVEHLISESNQPTKKWTYIPDGDYDGFKWENGKWVFVEKLYNQITPLGKEPVPAPIRDNEGNIDINKLKKSELVDEDINTPSTTTEEPEKPAKEKKKKKAKE